MGIADFRGSIGERGNAAHYQQEPTIITRNGRDWVGLVPVEWLAELDAYRARYGPLES